MKTTPGFVLEWIDKLSKNGQGMPLLPENLAKSSRAPGSCLYLLPSVFSVMEALSERTFTLGAAAGDGSVNAQCSKDCSPADSFMAC